LDAVLGDLDERLAVECGSRTSGDVERARALAFFFRSNWSNFVSPGIRKILSSARWC